MRLVACLLAGIGTLGLTPAATAAPTFHLSSIIDPTGVFQLIEQQIADHVEAAGRAWGEHFRGIATIEVQVRRNDSLARAGGTWARSSFVRQNGAFSVWESGAASEVRSGVDVNGSSPDLLIDFNFDYLFSELWLDPDPFTRDAATPVGKTDAMSVFMHEIGHGLGMNGWRDWTTLELSGTSMSVMDTLIAPIFGVPHFFGASASAHLGGPVPLTAGNVYHVGNRAPLPGAPLVGDLMNGVVFLRGVKYDVSDLDLLIMQDLGYAIVPAPGAAVSLCMICQLGLLRRRRA